VSFKHVDVRSVIKFCVLLGHMFEAGRTIPHCMKLFNGGYMPLTLG